jgi:hypothetical protein
MSYFEKELNNWREDSRSELEDMEALLRGDP